MKILLFILFMTWIFLSSCSPKPEPIEFGRDDCVLCKMIISQKPWGAEIVTNHSRTLKFDAIECMAKYINDSLINQEHIHSCWVVDYSNPGELINANDAGFLRSRTLPSPMAMFLSAFSTKENLKETMKTHKGDVLDWNGVKAIVKEEWGD